VAVAFVFIDRINHLDALALGALQRCYHLVLQGILFLMEMIDFASLSAEERLQLLEQLWDSLAAAPATVPVTAAQRAELDRRLDELDREGPVGIPWNDVLHAIRTRAA